MTSKTRANLFIGLGCLALGLVVAFIWVPLDTDTGLIEKVRRRVSIGDALAPTIAAAFVGLGGLLLLLSERNAEVQPFPSRNNLRFVLFFLVMLVIVFGVMRWAGPFAVQLTGSDEPYRTLRDTAPWKWIGFALGGFGLVVSLISAVERRLRLRTVIIGVAAVIALIAIFDLPFDDLLLPPNGDV